MLAGDKKAEHRNGSAQSATQSRFLLQLYLLSPQWCLRAEPVLPPEGMVAVDSHHHKAEHIPKHHHTRMATSNSAATGCVHPPADKPQRAIQRCRKKRPRTQPRSLSGNWLPPKRHSAAGCVLIPRQSRRQLLLLTWLPCGLQALTRLSVPRAAEDFDGRR
jgi:hypothetical protein